MDVLKIIFVCLLGMLICIGIIVASCVACNKEVDGLEHPEFIEVDRRE